MDINLGELDLNGVSFRKDTSIDELFSKPGYHAYVDNNGTVDLFTSEMVNVDGYTFNVTAYFFNKHIDRIRLIPVNLGMEDPGYPDKKYQEEKKKVADAFLRTNLGTPSKESETVLYYSFEWGSISSVIFLTGRNEYTGGFIEISYNK